MAIPITCEGIQYDSIKSAAKAFNISEDVAAYRIIKRGWPPKKALTTLVRNTGRPKTVGWASKRVFVRQGKGPVREYPSIKSAIEALHLQDYAYRIYARIRNGESVQKAFDTAHEDHNRNTMTVTINGEIVHFESMSEACRQLNLKYYSVRARKQRGWSDEEALEISPRKTKRKPNPNVRPVKFIHNKKTYKFESFTQACNYFNQNPSSVRHRIDDLGWTYQHAFLLKTHPSMSQKTFGYIYLITDLTNSQQYVGQTKQTIQERFMRHIGDAKLSKHRKSKFSLQHAIASKGIENFNIKQLDTATTAASLNKKERHYIKKFNTYKPSGYNLTKGGAGKNPKGIQYIVCGELFTSISEVARRYGKNPRTVNNLLNKKSFTIEQALGLEKAPTPNYKKPLFVFNGESYQFFETIAVAARYFKIQPSVLGDRLRRGWTPEEALEIKSRKRQSGPKKVTITIDGVRTVFSSHSEAAKAYNINPMLFTSRITNHKWTVEEALEIVPRKKPAIDSMINGKKVIFNTFKEAAEAYDIKPCTLEKRLKSGYTLEEALDLKVRPFNHPNMNKIELEIKGVRQVLSSYSEAERQLGLKKGVISNRLKNGWTLEQAAGLSPRPNNLGQSKAVKFEHNGKQYNFESESAAARHFNIERRQFSYLLKRGLSVKQALGLEQHRHTPYSPRPVIGVYKGKLASFSNMTEASNVTGINMRTIRARIMRNVPKEEIFLPPNKKAL